MKICNLMINNHNFNAPTFSGRKKKPENIVKDLLPEKLTLNEVETEYNDLLVQSRRVSNNIYTQKQNLRNYYSRADRDDYRELLKERQNLNARMKRVAKKTDIPQNEFEIGILAKKEYNIYAPKIYRAKTMQDLEGVIKLISESTLFTSTKEMLSKLIAQWRIVLTKR